MYQFHNRPLALVIVDGWGIGSDPDPNAIAQANTPFYDEICRSFPTSSLDASGEAVGLPKGFPGNAEAGHLNIGTGRIAKTGVMRIADAINNGTFFENPALVAAFQAALEGTGRVHIIGLLSDAEVHSSHETLFALLRMAKKTGLKDVFVHGILDGRDVPARTADIYTEAVEIKMADIGIGRIATLCGRYFAMDRAERWERTARAYTMLVHGEGERATDAPSAIRSSFLRGISDEFIAPIVIADESGEAIAPIRDGDSVIFFNHRPDTMRQLVRSISIPDAGGAGKPNLNAVCMTEYDSSFGLPAAFCPKSEKDNLADALLNSGSHFFRFSETERSSHITDCFDGGAYLHRSNEKIVQIQSGKETDLEFAPEMRNFKIADALLREIELDPSAVFVANFASPGRIAETGNFRQTIEAVEHLDTCLGGIINKISRLNGVAVITASHGNCESMLNNDGTPDRFATTNRVPLHVVGNAVRGIRLNQEGSLRDVAPTVLGLLGYPVPEAMTGENLILGR